MHISLFSIFPDIFNSFLATSLIAKAQEKSLLSFELIDFRKYAASPHYKVDDEIYGGGAGMLMKPEPIVAAVEDHKKKFPSSYTILLTPRGKTFNQEKAIELSKYKELNFICARYEGVDERVSELVVDEEISIGDYILMGGEVAAMVVIEAVARLLDDILGNEESIKNESFNLNENGEMLIEAPQYTRPEEYRGIRVPSVLLSGDHKKIAQWRLEKSKIVKQKE